jgi:hypothetical protein
LTGGTALARSAAAITLADMIGSMGAVIAYMDGVGGCDLPGQPWNFIGQRQEGLAFRTGEAAARMFAQEKKHKSENQTETDGEGERNDGHGI